MLNHSIILTMVYCKGTVHLWLAPSLCRITVTHAGTIALCDPIWHVISHCSVMVFDYELQYLFNLLTTLTYLQTDGPWQLYSTWAGIWSVTLMTLDMSCSQAMFGSVLVTIADRRTKLTYSSDQVFIKFFISACTTTSYARSQFLVQTKSSSCSSSQPVPQHHMQDHSS